MTGNSARVTDGQGQRDRDRGTGTWRKEMHKDKDRNTDRVTGPDVQEQRDMEGWIGQGQEEGESDRARCTGTEG